MAKKAEYGGFENPLEDDGEGFSAAMPEKAKVGRKPYLTADEKRDYPISVRLTYDEREAIKVLARYADSAVSELVQNIIREYVETHAEELQMQRDFDRKKRELEEGKARCRSKTVDGPSTRRRWTYRPSKPWR